MATKKKLPKIGITESGDASIDYTWMDKAADMDMMILITKHVTDEFIEKVMLFANKTIIHATCTGYGGSIMEPGVPKWQDQLEQVRKLIAYGFPAEQIVVRIDPIIPTEKACARVEKIVEYIHRDVHRFRISVLDNYPHVKKRFAAAGLPVLYNGNFQAPDEDFERVNRMLSRLKFRFPGVTFESCAEPKLTNVMQKGCVCAEDMKMFGLKAPNTLKENRNGCLCVSGKVEMLPFKHFRFCDATGMPAPGKCEIHESCATCEHCNVYGCSNMCIYCYWKS